ncbi:MFS transporter [Oscillospiraceae bacterium HV4-5-C5C]|nr:MFS transporter [Oscillospiraceae bacterium HV4-5-C5C]
MAERRFMKQVTSHPLIRLLLDLRGNPRTCVWIEPLWGVPNNLIAPFVTVYMYALGVNDVGIGSLLSLAMLAQVICSFAGGIVADKFGRKTVTMFGDMVGWVLPCLVWAVAQNYWFFLVAMLLNSFEQVNQTAWTCLLVEDADKTKLVGIYSWITIAGLLAVFFSPISGALIRRFSLIPVMRSLYFIYSLAMLLKCWITWRHTTETTQGRIRMAETRQQSLGALLLEYRSLLPQIFHSRQTLQTLGIMVILYTTTLVNNNFVSLRITRNLGVDESYLAYYPILRAAFMLVFMFAIQHRLERLRMKIPMTLGLLFYVGAQLLLILAPAGHAGLIAFYFLLEAMGFALVVPRKDSMVALSVDPQERARIVALLTAFMIAFSSPFGYLVGLLSETDSRLPFAFNIVLYLLAFAIVLNYQGKAEARPEPAGPLG